MNDSYFLCSIDDVAPGESKFFALKSEGQTKVEIALFNVDGKFYAISEKCQHKQGPLSKGVLDGMIVT